MKISIIHPSRQRAKKAFNTIMSWLGKLSMTVEIEYILSVDEDDLQRAKYVEINRAFGFNINVITNPNRSAVDAINSAAKESTGDILIVISDDFDCPENWDLEILKYCIGRRKWIMKTNDGIQEWIITLPIMDRAYYEQFGYIYHPEYLHMFCDTELTCIADLTGCKIDAPILFRHNHYSVSGGKDAVSEKADATWNQGESLFLSRYKENFGLLPEQIKGEITSQQYKTWIRHKI